MPLKYDHRLIPLAKHLRKNATSQENELWYKFLRAYPVRFQRQKAIGRYIADFYCHQARLVIELDGGQHYTPEALVYDAQRTQALQALGLTVVRVTNREVDVSFPAVCQMIDNTVHACMDQLP